MKKRMVGRYLSKSITRQSSDGTKITESTWSGYLPVALVALIGVSITIVAVVQSVIWEKRQVEHAFREASQDRVLVVQREFEHVLGVVEDIASIFEASSVVNRQEFRKFVGPALKRQAGINSLQWVPVVLESDRLAFIEEARRSFPPFQIVEADRFGGLTESRRRPVYYPVLYIQPYQSNKELLGLNLGTDPIISSLLGQVEESGYLRVSLGFSIADEISNKSGIVVAVPVFYRYKNPGDIQAKVIPKIRGFAIGNLYVGDIVERALNSLRTGGVDLHFYQSPNTKDGQLLYTHLSRSRKEHVSDAETNNLGISYKQKVSVGNQHWEVVCKPAPGKFKTETLNSWIIFLGGIAFSTLLTIYLASLVGRARKVRLEVEERTVQLQEAVEALNREVSERISAERELQVLNETLEHRIISRTTEAERKAQDLEQFAYVTSHDLKAPLRAVSHLASWIEEDLVDKLDDESREQLALLRDRVRRMHDLIEGLLEYSRIGKAGDSEDYVDIGELVNEIIDSLSPPDSFKIKVKGNMPTLYADRLQLGQVFSNLISNSLKHHGGKKGKIRIKGERYGDIYQFSVCDDGCGIASDFHDKIFMMFQTLESRDIGNSTGIGLALVKKIVEEHGGKVRLVSTVGEGSCFYFTWPEKHPG